MELSLLSLEIDIDIKSENNILNHQIMFLMSENDIRIRSPTLVGLATWLHELVVNPNMMKMILMQEKKGF